MKSIRVDRERAIKMGALAALILLTVTFLPDLLRSPKPPSVPADVGFSPTDTGTTGDGLPIPPGTGEAARRGQPASGGRKRRVAAAKDVGNAGRGKEVRRKVKKIDRRRSGSTSGSSSSPAPSTPPAAPSAPPPAASSSPPPAAPSSPPSASSTPSPAPTPAPSPHRQLGDGSQEFAPR